MKFRRSAALWAVAAVMGGASLSAKAVTVTASGTNVDSNPIAAQLDFTVVGNVATVTLSNQTLNTLDAGQLLTAVDLTLAGVGPVTLTSGSAIGRDVAADGSFVDSGSVNLLSPATWSLTQVSGNWRLSFNPDAQYAILGAPTAGSYSGANGSIAGNPGHNPFAAETATFQITASGLTEASLTGVTFKFGTDFASSLVGNVPPTGNPPPIPEPASMMLLGMGVAALCLRLRAQAK